MVISIVLCILCCILCLLCAVRQRHKAKEQDKEEAKARVKREAGGWAAGSIAADAIERANTHAHADHLPFDDDKDLHVHVPGTHKDIDIHIPKKVRSGIRSLFSAEHWLADQFDDDGDDDLGETDLLEAIAPLEEESEFADGGAGGSSESLGSPRVGIDSSRLSSADPGAPQPPPAGSAMSYPQTPGGGRRGSAPEVADPRKQSLVSKQV